MLSVQLSLCVTAAAQAIPTPWAPVASRRPPETVTPLPEVVLQTPRVTDSTVDGATPGVFPTFSEPATVLQLFPQGIIYRAYLAGVKESRLQGVWNRDTRNGWLWDITLGGRVGLLRYGSPAGTRPEGFQIDLEGAGLPRLNLDENADLEASDFRFGIPITWGTARHQVKFAYYHLSSHVADEFLLKHPGFNRLNYSRNVLVYGHSFYPTPWTRLYGEIGYAFTVDVAEPLEAQFGWEYSPPCDTGLTGAPFAAIGAHLREEVDFGGNLVAQIGWAWRSRPDSGLLRLGVQYYNGKNDQFSFFDVSENKIGLGIWYDY